MTCSALSPTTSFRDHLAKADLAFAPLNAITALKSHPDFATMDVLVDDQLIQLPRVPGLPKPSGQRVPRLGEHTAEVLGWLESADD